MSEVRQGCVLAPALFCVAIDWILNHTDSPGFRVGSSSQRPVMESIRRRREAIFGHVARMSPNIPAHQALRLQVEASIDIDDLTAIGFAALDVLATAGSTNSVRTINAHLLTYGKQPSGVVILERRYGPRRLRDDDDDIDDRKFRQNRSRGLSVLHCIRGDAY